MSTNAIQLFLGDPIRDPNESRFVRRLRADLAERGIEAMVLANFIADPKRQARQVDFLVWTAHRLAHVELKSLDPRAPLHAPANGHWTQHLPGGQTRTLGNGFRQARDTTYAISDDLRRIARREHLPGPEDGYYRFIDTVVCVQPEVPEASNVQPLKHATMCGYADLLERLGRAGSPPPGWTAAHVESVARELGLYAEPDDLEAAAAQQVDLNHLATYRSSVVLDLASDLHELVPLSMTGDADQPLNPVDVLDHCLASGDLVTVTGPSGSGKTHAVRHAVLNRTRTDAVPVWLSCRDYDGDTFSVAMAKAVARFSSHRWSDLFYRARRQGLVPVIVLDGLGECRPEQQRTLLEGVRAYRNGNACAVVVTDQQPPPLDASRRLFTQPPDTVERDKLLSSYGAPLLSGADAFTTVWELAMAAQCATELPPGADHVDVVDTYCRRLSSSEVQRDQLRALAVAMRSSFKVSLPLAQVRPAIANLVGRVVTADEIDALLRCPLLQVGPQRVAFAHESLGRFLAAQHLVLAAADGLALAARLREPALADLSELAIRIETDTDRRVSAMTALARPELLAQGALGRYGLATELRVQAAMRDVLVAMQAVTAGAHFVFTDDLEQPGTMPGHWERPHITCTDVVLLDACGRCLSAGILIPEVVALLDVTDERSDAAMKTLQEQGVRAPISAVVALTYAPSLSRGQDISSSTAELIVGDLPASILLRAAYFTRFNTFNPSDNAPRATRVRYEAPGQARWGRVSAALMMVNVHSDEDLNLLPDLVSEAWTLNGYHMRLEALDAAHSGARWMDSPARLRLRDVLEDLDTSNNWALSSLHGEALAACGAIEAISTEQDIRAEIDQVLSNADDPNASGLARSILGRQFEDEAIFGPVSEVLASLDPRQLVSLCGLALLDEDATLSIIRDWAVARIADHIDVAGPQERRLIEQIAADPPAASFAVHEGLNAHLDALRAWSSIADELPAPSSAFKGPAARTWRLIDELAFPLLSGAGAGESREVWMELHDLCRPTAVDALLQMGSAMGWSQDRSTIYEQLAEEYPDELRLLFEWALDKWDQVRPAIGTHVHAWREVLLHELGRVGDDRTRALLESHLDLPELASSTVNAIREIEARLSS
jgi:RecA/RadA recombinase